MAMTTRPLDMVREVERLRVRCLEANQVEKLAVDGLEVFRLRERGSRELH